MRTRAAIIREPGKPWELTELELDEPGPGEVRIKFAASGMCHSDEHLRTGDSTGRLPMVGGHGGGGLAEPAGRRVPGERVGAHVASPFIPAGGPCRYCSTGHQNLCDWGAQMMTGMLADGTFRFHDDDGADLGGFCMLGTFAERAVVSQNSCVPIETDIPFEVAALTGCGVPTGWGTAVYAAGGRAGQAGGIFGGGGGGCHAAPEEVIDLTRGQLADHALITIGVLNAEVVDQAAAIVGKGCQVTITSVGRSAEKQIQLAANGSVVGWQRRIQGHVFGMCNPLNDIPRLLRLSRAGQLKLDELIPRRYPLDDVNQGYQDLDDGKIIRGVITHAQ